MLVNIGKGIELDVNAESLPANAMAHVVYIGLRNILMDAHASATSDTADHIETSRALAEKKLAALMSGEVRVTSSRTGDPVKAEAIRIATDAIKRAMRKAGKKIADVDAKALRDAAERHIAANPSITELARKRVDEAKALGDVDIGDLA